MIFGSNPVDSHTSQHDDSNLQLAKDTSISTQFAQHWELRALAQEASLEKIANSQLRRLSVRNQSFACTDVAAGDPAPFSKVARRKRPDRSVTAEFQEQTFKVARRCVL